MAENMSSVANSLLKQHILYRLANTPKRAGAILLHVRLVCASWHEAGNEVWLALTARTWEHQLLSWKHQRAVSQCRLRMLHASEAQTELTEWVRTSASPLAAVERCVAPQCIAFRMLQLIHASPLLHLATLILMSLMADGYSGDCTDAAQLAVRLAPSLLSSTLMLGRYGVTNGCYPVLREWCLFRSYCRAFEQLRKLDSDDPSNMSELSEPENEYDLEQAVSSNSQASLLERHHILLNQMPKWAPFPASQATRGMKWKNNNPVFCSVWPALASAGLVGGLMPFTFVVLLWLQMAHQWLNWYVVFAPLVLGFLTLALCAALFRYFECGPRSDRRRTALWVGIPMLLSLSFSLIAARVAGAITWPFWACFTPIFPLALLMLAGASVTFPVSQNLAVKLLWVLFILTFMAFIGGIVLLPFVLDNFVDIPFTVLTAGIATVPFGGTIFLVFVYV